LDKRIIKVIFILGVIIRFSFLFMHQDMWHDASFTYEFSQKPIGYLLNSNDVHPPLYYLIMKAFISISSNELFLRSTSILFYILFFYVLYKHLYKNFNNDTTYLTLLFVSFSPTMVFYSLEVRNYMLGMFFVMAQVYYFFEIINEKEETTKFDLILFLLFSTLMVYTHYFTAFMLLVELGFLCFYRPKEDVRRFAFFLYLYPFLCIPLLIHFFRTLPKIHSMWFKDITVLSFISTISYQFFLPETLIGAHILFYVFFFFFVLFLFITKTMLWRTLSKFMMMAFFLPVVLLFLISQIHPLYHHRFFLFYSFAIYILLAQTIAYLISNKGYKSLLGAFFLISFFLLLVFSMGLLPSVIPKELYESQLTLKNSLDKTNKYVFIHKSPFSQTPMKYYFRDWNIINLLNTSLTKKQRFSAGGSVIEDWEVISANETIYCYGGCIFFLESARYKEKPEHEIYYNKGGLVVYGLEKKG